MIQNKPKLRFNFSYGIVREFNDHTYKLMAFKYPFDTMPELRETRKKGEANDRKLSNNISRTRSMIYDLVASNPWQHFVTLTIDGEKYNRENLRAYEKDLQTMIKNYNAYNKTEIKFLFIPELHADKKSYHMHGLMSGLPDKCLTPFTSDMYLPERILKKLDEGKRVFEWKQYRTRFGFCELEEVQNPDAVSGYMTKYITEDLASTVQDLNAHSYFCSRGLKRSKIVCRGTLISIPEMDFENDYVAIKKFENKDEARKFFIEKEDETCSYLSIFQNGLTANV